MEKLQEKTQASLERARELVEEFAVTTNNPEDFRLDVTITVANLIPAVEKLFKNRWGYLSTITGLDHPGAAEQPSDENRWEKVQDDHTLSSRYERAGVVELLYHFSEGMAVTTLRVSVPYTKPILPSICGVIPSANFYEMEIAEMFGVNIENIPSKEHLLLPDDWPEDVYPLRKSFTGLDNLPGK